MNAETGCAANLVYAYTCGIPSIAAYSADLNVSHTHHGMIHDEEWERLTPICEGMVPVNAFSDISKVRNRVKDS